MRPLEISFGAFGPYAGEETVDFERLGKDGLFLICGETGSGKTMLLDAMMFALYGRSSGHGRDDFASMRCTNADNDADTYVRFTFESEGTVYVFERRLEKKRKNLSPSYSMKRKRGDSFEVLSENPKEKELNEKAKEIIGLDYNQFRQVIVLPQGQFEKLLTSGSDEKEKILTDIFGERKWQDISERFYEEASLRQSELAVRKQGIKARLDEEDCADIAELSEKADKKRSELKALDDEFERHDYGKEKERLQESLALSKRFEDLNAAFKEMEFLKGREKEYDGLRAGLKDAERAENVREYVLNERRCTGAFRDRTAEFESAERNEKTAEKKASEIKAALKEHVASEDRIEELKRTKSAYEARILDYGEAERLGKEISEKKEAYDAASGRRAARNDEYRKVTYSLFDLRSEYARLRQENDSILARYIRSMSGILAKDLADGMPCPVCGSREHPERATLSDEDVTKETVDRKKKEENEKYEEIQERGREQEAAKLKVEEADREKNRAYEDVMALKRALESIRANLIDGIDTEEELEAAIDDMARKIGSFEERKRTLLKRETEVNDALIKARAAVEEKMKSLSDAEGEHIISARKLDNALRENGISSAAEAESLMLPQGKVEELRRRILQYDTDRRNTAEKLERLKLEVKGLANPDKGACSERIREIDGIEQKYSADRATVKNEYERLNEKLEKLTSESRGLDEAVRRAEEDLSFAKKLRGNTGTSLQRYVLGIMFSSVVSQANRMLELVHGGRYRLYRTDDRVKGSNKRGLELKVYDRYSASGEGRFVNTLSGGEKFLASLALSIGLSTVAQKSGIRIEALFIDEGFGSLDENSIVDAMEVLNTVRNSSGLVGIISHVNLLSERIPARLTVEKKDGVSHISESFG